MMVKRPLVAAIFMTDVSAANGAEVMMERLARLIELLVGTAAKTLKWHKYRRHIVY